MWHRVLVLVAGLFCLPAASFAGALEDSLKAFFAAGVAWQDARAELIEVQRWPETTGAVRWSLPPQSRPMQRISLLAEQGEGRDIRRWYVPVRVHWWADVVVPRQNLNSRTLLAPSMLKVIREDVAGLRDWWSRPADLAGMRSTRTLRQDAPISSYAVMQPPLIQRGDRVTISVQVGSLQVFAEGRALRAAGKGEKVRVENLSSHQILQAVAVDQHTVKVHPGGA